MVRAGINLISGSIEFYSFIAQVICKLPNMSNSKVNIGIGWETCKYSYTCVLCNNSKHMNRKCNLNGIGPANIRLI